MTSTKLTAGAAFPDISWPAVGGDQLEIAKGTGWRLLVVYRGQHCPLSKGYLKTLNELANALTQLKSPSPSYRPIRVKRRSLMLNSSAGRFRSGTG